MGTILSEMANWYGDFYRDGKFDAGGAYRVLRGLSDMERRCEYFNCFYDILLNSSKISETVKIFLKTRKSYADVAFSYNKVHELEEWFTKKKTAAQVKAEVCYANKRIMNVMSFQREDGQISNYPHAVFFDGNMTEECWRLAEQALIRLRTLYGKSLIDKGEIWINIPVGEYATEIEDDEFDSFLEIIKPYFQKQKMVSQKRINGMTKACGYLNYIMRNEMKLNETDLSRKNRVLEMLRAESEEVCAAGENPTLRKMQDRINELERIISIKESLATEAMAEAGKVVYSRLGVSLEPEHKRAMRMHFEEYNKLRKELSEIQEERDNIKKDLQKLSEQNSGNVDGNKGEIIE